jgi:hypothetical protein
MVVHAWNPSTWKAEAGGFLVPNQRNYTTYLISVTLADF